MAKYYVDSINGNDTNDGLTPSTAFASIFVDVGATALDVSEFWVRRTSNLVMIQNEILKYSKVIYWPEADGEMYDVRPAEGISDGWDADSTYETGIDFATYYIATESVNDAIVEFYNITLFSTSTAGTEMFRIKAIDFVCKNGSLDSVRTNVNKGIFYIVTGSGAHMNISFFDSVVNFPSTALLGKEYASNVAIYYPIYVFFTDCTVTGYYGLYWYQYSSKNQYDQHFSFIDSDVTFSGPIIYRRETGSGYDYGDVKFISKRSKIVASYMLEIYFTENNYVPGLSFDIIDSELLISNDLFRLVSNAGRAGSSSGPMNIIRSKISCDSILSMYKQSSSTTRFFYFYSKINIIDCEIAARNWLFEIHYPKVFNGINFRGNKLLSMAAGLLYASFDKYANDTTDVGYSYFDVSDCSLGSHALYGSAENISINLTDVGVAGEIATSGCKGIKANLNFCDCTGLRGDGDYTVARSTIVNNSGTAINNITSATIRNSIVKSRDAICVASGDVVIMDSDVEMDMVSPARNGTVRLFNSKLNGINTAYASVAQSSSKEISPIYRVNGADGSLLVSGDSNKMLTASVDELRTPLGALSTTVNAFIAMPRELDPEIDTIQATFHFVDIDGAGQSVNCSFAEDTASGWDGLPVGAKFYYLTADIAGFDRDITQHGYMNINIVSSSGPVKKVIKRVVGGC